MKQKFSVDEYDIVAECGSDAEGGIEGLGD